VFMHREKNYATDDSYLCSRSRVGQYGSFVVDILSPLHWEAFAWTTVSCVIMPQACEP